jgi:hypothetical protein
MIEKILQFSSYRKFSVDLFYSSVFPEACVYIQAARYDNSRENKVLQYLQSAQH